MSAPTLSIIIPVFGVEDCIQRCLESLYSQDLDQGLYEIIIINDGTLDNSMQFVETFSSKHSNIVVHNKENGGVSSARNIGIKHAQGEYLLFLDPDDAIVPNSLNEICKELKTHPEVLILKSNKYHIGSDDAIEVDPFRDNLCKQVFSGEKLFESYFRGSICGVAVNRNFILENKILFEPEMRNAEDSLFFAEVMLCSTHIILRKIDYYMVFEREGSASTLWDVGKVFSALSNIELIKMKMDSQYCSTFGRVVLSHLIYIIISSMTDQLIGIPHGYRYIFKMNAFIKKSQCLPLSLKEVSRQSVAFRILNLSWFIMLLYFYMRRGLKSFRAK